ncbi:MAG: enoyl-CoA hydratase-related protein [Planctomycetota bacterium]|nr:enoyl-CoA hydratase-related protein [Planctomycetota bacterium]
MSDDTFKCLDCNIDDNSIAWLTITREKALNALNAEVLEELNDALPELYSYEDVKAIVISGAGEKAFVAGADISEFIGMSALEAKGLSQAGQEVFSMIESAPVPVIAMINGFALGGGLELAMACHLRVAAEEAMLGLPEVTLGLIPGFGGTQRLSRLASPGVAREWVLTGDMYSSTEAKQVGVVNKVAPASELKEVTTKLATTIIKRGPIAVNAALDVIRRGLEVGQSEGENLESDAFGLLFTTKDQVEGAEAFLEKRKPNFCGE